MENQGYTIRKERIGIEVSHNNSDLTFVYPAYGPDTYSGVKELIEKNGLSTPTLSETASLIYPAFVNDKERKIEEFNDIKKIMKDRWLLGFTGILYTPKLIYIQDNPETKNGMPFMEESELVNKLGQKDSSVRTVEYGFEKDSISPLELVKNPFIIALAGEEGADKLAQIADTFNFEPYLFALNRVTENQTRVSALSSNWNFDNRLDVDGNYLGDGRGGYALGVRRKNEEKIKRH